MDKAVFVLLGALILFANYWYVVTVYNTYFNPQVVVTPFRVVGSNNAGEKFGETLASLLDSRLVQIQRDLRDSQTELRKQRHSVPAEDPATAPVEASFVSTLPLPLIDMKTDLFQPADIDVKVSGVEVGGIFNWFQRKMARPRALDFSVFLNDNKATVSGDLSAISSKSRDALRFESKADPIEITDKIAFAIIQKKLVEADTKSIDALEIDEVESLLEALFLVASLNRKAVAGRPIAKELSGLFVKIEQIVKKVPDWPALVYFAATLAESSGQNDKALQYYSKLKELSAGQNQAGVIPVDIATIDQKIQDLAPDAERLTSNNEKTFQAEVDKYSKRSELPAADPKVVFKQLQVPGQMTFWNNENKTYEVDPEYSGSVELPLYVALMGRFMEKHYEKCFGSNAESSPAPEDWNDFRYSVVQFLVETDPEIGESYESMLDLSHLRLLRVLNDLSADTDTEVADVRKLAFKLLDQYSCDWTSENLKQIFVDINSAEQIGIPEESIQAAF